MPEDDLKSAQRLVCKLNQDVKRLEAEVVAKDESFEDLNKKFQASKKDVVKLQRTIKLNQQLKEQDNGNVVDLSSQLNELRDQLEKESQRAQDLAAQVQEKDKQLRKSTNAQDKLNKALDSVTELNDALKARDQMIQKLNQDLADSQRKMGEAGNSRERELDEVQCQLKDAYTTCEELSDAVKVRDATIVELKQNCEELGEAVKGRDATIDKLKQNCEELGEAVKGRDETIDKLNQDVASLQAMKTNDEAFTDLNQRVIHFEDQLRLKEAEFDRRVKELVGELEERNSTIQQLQPMADQATKERDELAKAQKLLQDRDLIIKDYGAKLSNLEIQIQKAVDEAKQHINDQIEPTKKREDLKSVCPPLDLKKVNELAHSPAKPLPTFGQTMPAPVPLQRLSASPQPARAQPHNGLTRSLSSLWGSTTTLGRTTGSPIIVRAHGKR